MTYERKKPMEDDLQSYVLNTKVIDDQEAIVAILFLEDANL